MDFSVVVVVVVEEVEVGFYFLFFIMGYLVFCFGRLMVEGVVVEDVCE
jgi:hypothetical protein